MQHANLHSCNGTLVGVPANFYDMEGPLTDKELIEDISRWSGDSVSAVARRSDLTPTTLTRIVNGEAKHKLKSQTILKLRLGYPGYPGWAQQYSDHLPAPELISYVPVDILPTYAGMGGGGNGEGEIERAMVPRYLIEDVFRGRPADFVVVRTRGDSMEPDFRQDDELLCDRRDTSPVQPGPFALWDAEDEAYVIKNVEKTTSGRVRIFSSNPKYSPREVGRDETRIIGRPVWFARRL